MHPRSLSRRYRLHLDRLRPGVERARDAHLLSGKLVRRLLVGQGIDLLARIEDEARAVGADAGSGALGVVRPHAHPGMIPRRALAVGNDTGEGLRALTRVQGTADQEAEQQDSHRC